MLVGLLCLALWALFCVTDDLPAFQKDLRKSIAKLFPNLSSELNKCILAMCNREKFFFRSTVTWSPVVQQDTDSSWKFEASLDLMNSSLSWDVPGGSMNLYSFPNASSVFWQVGDLW